MTHSTDESEVKVNTLGSTVSIGEEKLFELVHVELNARAKAKNN